MNTNLISKENNIAKFTLVFTADEFEDAIVDAYKKNKDKFSIDGFRKGKAPRKIIENNYGDDIFYDEALNGLLNKAYLEARSSSELRLYPLHSFQDSSLHQPLVLLVSQTRLHH